MRVFRVALNLNLSTDIFLVTVLPKFICAIFYILLATMALCGKLYADEGLKVTINGIEDELLENVRNTLTINQLKHEKDQNKINEQNIKRSHAKADEQIKQALRPFGYYQPIIDKSLVKQEKNWLAQYKISPGPATTINQVNIQIEGPGKEESTVKQWQENSLLKIGDQLNHPTYEDYKQKLYNALFELGYINAKYIRSEMRVDVKNNKADIVLLLKSGQQFFFGDVKVEQNIIDEEKINRLITVDRDTPFNTDHLLALQLKLSDTGYFATTSINIERDKVNDQRIPVTIKTVPTKKLTYSTSIGYGTDTGARIGFSIHNRRVNTLGHRFQSSAQLSEVESNISSQYIIPIKNINTEYIDLFANINQEIVNDIEATQYSIGSSLNENKWGGRRRISLTLLEEQFSFDDQANKTANLLIPGLTYIYKDADATLFTHKGYSITTDIHGGIESTLSETTFLHTRLSARSVFPVTDKMRLLNRLELGFIESDEFFDLPPSERFFTGGAQSVRGYAYKDIGPRNEFNNNVGGDHLVASSIELDYLPWGNYGFAIFYDAGDVADSTDFSLKKAAGIGFRYRSVIGMIRVDLAHPFDDPDKDVRLHISLGPDL